MVRAGTQASGTYSSCALIFPRYAGDGRRFRHGARGGAFLALLLPKPPVQRPGASLVSCILQDFQQRARQDSNLRPSGSSSDYEGVIRWDAARNPAQKRGCGVMRCVVVVFGLRQCSRQDPLILSSCVGAARPRGTGVA